MAEQIKKKTPLDQAFLKTVPTKPGVYQMMDNTGKILYVGKARDLKNRLTSYARPDKNQTVKTVALLKKVATIETIITATEKEALILEASLIKKHRPRYNVILRDDKNYPYIKVTIREEWPRVLMTRRRKSGDGARYFGPYSSPGAMWSVLHMLRKVFPLRRCKGRELKARKRPCLNYQMQGCLAPCMGKADPVKYQKMVASVIDFLEGKNRHILANIEKEMQSASERLDFENAALYRDRIKAFQSTLEKQVVVAEHHKDQDVFGLVRQDISVALACLQIRKGVIVSQQTFFHAQSFGNNTEILAQVLERYYDEGRQPPTEILVSNMPESVLILEEVFSSKRGAKVSIRVPKRGDGVRLLAMAEQNSSEVFVEREKREKSWQVLSRELQKSLKLTFPPERIECLDISNLSGKQAVGSLVVFTQGIMDKAEYRHYKIKEVSGPDDYAMMAEVLQRRFVDQKKKEVLPNLLLLDGGKGQLNTAFKVVQENGLTEEIDLLGIAKDKNDKGERIFAVNRKNPLSLAQNSLVLLFLMRIRDEAHRFGITFHRKLRTKKTLRSSLDDIPGIGPTRKQALLLAFGSLKEISKASEEDLANVHTIGPELATIIHKHLQKENYMWLIINIVVRFC